MTPINEQMARGYREATVFTDAGPDSEYSAVTEFSPRGIAQSVEQCSKFLALVESAHLLSALTHVIDSSQSTWDQIGVDLWLTRNGHGVGFWARDALKDDDLGEALTELCKPMRDAHLYLSAEGLEYE